MPRHRDPASTPRWAREPAGADPMMGDGHRRTTRSRSRRSSCRSPSTLLVVAVALALVVVGCTSADVAEGEAPPVEGAIGAEDTGQLTGDPQLREQWARLLADADETDMTPTVIGMHALLDEQLPIIDIDPATGPWMVSRTGWEPVRQCFADVALTAVVALRQHDASDPSPDPAMFVSMQSDILEMAPGLGWQVDSEEQFLAGHPAYEDGVRGTIFRLEGHGDVWFVTVSYEPDSAITISYCPADLDVRPDPVDAGDTAEQARAAIGRGDYAAATRLVDRALATDPTNRQLQILGYAQHGDQMLHAAFWAGDEEAVALIAGIVPDVDLPDDRFGSSALVLAAAWSQTGMVRVLLDAGADPNVGADKDGLTALMWSAKNFDEQLEMARMLLEAGAEVNVRSGLGETPLQIAQQYDNPNIVALLREYGAEE